MTEAPTVSVAAGVDPVPQTTSARQVVGSTAEIATLELAAMPG